MSGPTFVAHFVDGQTTRMRAALANLGRVLNSLIARTSGFGGEAEILCSSRALQVLTHSRHGPD